MFARRVDEELPPSSDESGWASFLRGNGGDAGGSLVRVFTRVVTPEWVSRQVERAADELTAYLVARSDGFELRIELDDAQVAEAADEINAIIGEADERAQDRIEAAEGSQLLRVPLLQDHGGGLR